MKRLPETEAPRAACDDLDGLIASMCAPRLESWPPVWPRRSRRWRAEPRRTSLAADMDDPDLARGLELLRERRWFEAHEAIEEAWRRASGPRRDALRALIHGAAALEHLRRGNRVGARLQAAKAANRLSGPAAAALADAVDAPPWVAALCGLVEAAQPGEPATWPVP